MITRDNIIKNIDKVSEKYQLMQKKNETYKIPPFDLVELFVDDLNRLKKQLVRRKTNVVKVTKK